MPTDLRTVIAVNYHRIGDTDPANPLHRLHTVTADAFAAHLDLMQSMGRIMSPDQVRRCDGLAEVNFVVCFDDVPSSALVGIDLVRQRGLPVTVSVCGQLADDGWGTRDKVYAIEKFTDPQEVQARTKAWLPADAVELAGLPFYHLTKSAALDPGRVRTELIDPLFADVRERAAPYLSERGYLSWPTLRDLAGDPLVTVANHTYSHDNLAALNPSAVRREIMVSHERFTERIGPVRYFTVPFGRLTQELALDCLDPLTDLGYAGILWVGSAGLRLRRPYRHQVLNLPRLHADPDPGGFARQVEQAIARSSEAAIWQVRPTLHRCPVTITASRRPRRALVAEMLMRQGKDYASDPAYYRHQFTDNPYRGDRPDYYAAERQGRIEALAYNFHTAFVADGIVIPGVYLAGWRKLPHCHPASGARLLAKILSREAIVGVHNPNPDIHHAFTGWCKAVVQRLSLPVDPACHPPSEARLRHEETSTYPPETAAMCAASVRDAGFTVVRDPAYHRWRYNTYPLAATTYLTLYRRRPVALAIVQHQPGVVRVADFHLDSPAEAAALARAVLAFAARRGATSVGWDTSSAEIARLAVDQFAATATPYANFYHLDAPMLARLGAQDLTRRWPTLALHETATTADVLLR